jgi:hypothetical protein
VEEETNKNADRIVGGDPLNLLILWRDLERGAVSVGAAERGCAIEISRRVKNWAVLGIGPVLALAKSVQNLLCPSTVRSGR